MIPKRIVTKLAVLLTLLSLPGCGALMVPVGLSQEVPRFVTRSQLEKKIADSPKFTRWAYLGSTATHHWFQRRVPGFFGESEFALGRGKLKIPGEFSKSAGKRGSFS